MFPIFLMNFFFAISTTIAMTFMPLLITDGLGLSLLVLGVIEGSTEFISNILRLISGNLFDRIQNRRLLFVIPAALALCSKIILYLPSTLTIIASKTMERTANGAFAAPRDAYIGENAKNKGVALGFLSFSKTCGCVLGPLIVSGIIWFFGSLQEHMIKIISLACIVNAIAFCLAFAVTTKKKIALNANEEFKFSELKESFKNVHFLFILSFLFFLGRFNDGIIMLYLKKLGFPEWFYLATISFFNFIMLLISPFMGYYVDKKKDYYVLFITILALFGFNVFFLQLQESSWIFASLGIVCWGIQRAGAQITFPAMIFKNTPVKYYGTAIGVYSLLSGLGVFISSMISGYLAQSTFIDVFILSGFFSLVALSLAIYMHITKRY